MRVAILALFLCVPLLAEEESALQKSVEQWRSGKPVERDAASVRVDRELRRLLAPLLKAMEDEDPEMRRRARGALFRLAGVDGRDTDTLSAQLDRIPDERFRKALRALIQQKANQANGLPPVVARRRARVETAEQRRAREFEQRLGITTRTTGFAKPFAKGVRVMTVSTGSRADRLGVMRGDVIVLVDGKRVSTSDEIRKAAGQKPDWSKIKLTVVRANEIIELARGR